MGDLDKTDRQILSILETDGRVSFSDLAQRIGLSKTPCWNRVKELERRGVITGFSSNIDSQLLGLNLTAVVHVIVDFNQSSNFEKAIVEHKHVINCLAVTGDFDYVLKVIAKDVSELDDLLRNQLSRVPGVQRFSTAIATRTIKATTKLSLI
jgi:Lrp/AsnC family leucine-responsive transcriptional regulator